MLKVKTTEVNNMGALWSWIRGFWQQEMEISIIGLENAGKSTLLHVIHKGEFVDKIMPTVGFNMHKVDKGKVQIKVWDLGGQKKFRGMWERYCRNNDAIVYVYSLYTAYSHHITIYQYKYDIYIDM